MMESDFKDIHQFHAADWNLQRIYSTLHGHFVYCGFDAINHYAQ